MNGSDTQRKAHADWRSALKLLLAFQQHKTPGTLETVAFGQTSVDVYQPPLTPTATVIFIPGLSIRGREDPRIRRLGWALSAGGLRVLIPDVSAQPNRRILGSSRPRIERPGIKITVAAGVDGG